MESFQDVLGHILARCPEVAVKKVINAYDADKSQAANIANLSSTVYKKEQHLEATTKWLKTYTAEFYPNATPLIRNMMTARNKTLIATDIVNVLSSITPTQCRTCKETYISTAAENIESTLSCLICGRKSHKNCYDKYTTDNDAGVVFLCDVCLTKIETKTIVDDEIINPSQGSDTKPESEHNKTTDLAGDHSVHLNEDTDDDHPDENDDICPLYRINSCPHGLTGKRTIDGVPCLKRHPPKCFYHTGKYGSSGCRYSDKRCRYFHPTLCENSIKLKMCLNKDCTNYHMSGTSRSYRDDKKPVEPPSRQRKQENIPPQSPPSMWNHQQTSHQPTYQPITQPSSHQPTYQPTAPPSNQQVHQNHDHGERDSFLKYLHVMKADMLSMKAEIERSVKDIVREAIAQKPSTEQVPPPQLCHMPTQHQSPQYITAENMSSAMSSAIANPLNHVHHNIQAYNQMYPGLPGQT